MRQVSYSEISKALRCEAAWDFGYGGHLAGGVTFSKRETAPRLSAGSAWGAGVATWHRTGNFGLAVLSIANALVEDSERMLSHDFQPDPDSLAEIAARVEACLAQYVDALPRHENYDLVEADLVHEIYPGWEFLCYLDGRMVRDGEHWIVENKFRDSLTDPEIIEKMPQYRWYAAAYRRRFQIEGAVGVMVEERLSREPEPPRLVQPKRKSTPQVDGKTVSHAKDQFTTGALYLQACEQYGVAPEQETVEVLDSRVWQQRVPLLFFPADLDAADRELESAVLLIDDLDSGVRRPIRSGGPSTCRSCDFSSICLDPTNQFLTKSMFRQSTPKRLRDPKPEGVR